MQHVDEGRLHAWLDGELPSAGPEGARALERHLQECAACRARADEERRIRDDASSLLRRADPGARPAPEAIPLPAPAPARRTARPWVALGWAASVLIALGIGWMARPEPSVPVAINAPPARRPAPAAEAAPAAREAQSAPTAAGVTRTAAAPAPQAEPVERRTAPPAGVTVPLAAPATPPASPPVALAEAPLAAPPPPPPPAVAVAAPPPPSVASAPSATSRTEEASKSRVTTLRGRVTDLGGVGVPGAVVAVPSLAARATTRADGSYTLTVPASADTLQVVATQIGLERQARSLVAQPESSATVDFALAPSVVALEGVVATAQGRAVRSRSTNPAGIAAPPAAAWRSAERTEAERQLGRPLVTVPSLPVLGIELRQGEERAAVRVTQRLPGGAVLSLLQRQGAGARAPRPCQAPASGATCIAFTRSGVLVEASAPVPADTLRAHLAPLF